MKAQMEESSPKIGWSQAWHPRHVLDASSLILLAANLIPLLGVFFWNWDLFTLMILYWMETAIIGFWHILRMVLEVKLLALFLLPFFCVHFGMFMTVHFIFLTALFGRQWAGQIHGPGDFFSKLVFGTQLWIPFLVLFISHGVSFFLNYKGLGPEQPPAPTDISPQLPPFASTLHNMRRSDIMTAPYKRVVVMHLTIIFGGMLSMIFHADKPAFLLLVALKTFVDLGSHVRKNFGPLPVAVPEPSQASKPQ